MKDLMVMEDNVIDPIRLTQEDLDSLTITLHGYKFYSFGGVLGCPTCGERQGIQFRLDPDKQLAFFLVFTCEHYKNNG